MEKVDKIIIGAGLYGLYSALFCAKKEQNIVVLEYDKTSFSRATLVNQARVHNGYHYPRSYSTAIKSAKYFNDFSKDFDFCINKNFKKIYATSSTFSWTNNLQFNKFCTSSNIKCEEIDKDKFFKKGVCDGVFETEEYTFDTGLLKEYFLSELSKFNNCKIIYESRIENISVDNDEYLVQLKNGLNISTDFILNSTYGSINQILKILNFTPFKIKYEICEIVLCKVSDNIKDTGITLMDGPFFSLMPFGNTGYHSLSSVTFTPHATSYSNLPTFNCQDNNVNCSPNQLENCNNCINKPKSAWKSMYKLAKKYLKEDIEIEYVKSLFSIKPILLSSEIDDSRPTLIKKFSNSPSFYSVLSGKINTIYDLNDILL